MKRNIINKSTFIIADTHFGHTNINIHEPIRLRTSHQNGYSDPDEFMIYRWNQRVKPDDIVFHLGDFAFKHPDILDLNNRLNGKKILLIGNHDKPKDVEILKDNGWKIIDSIIIDLEFKIPTKLDKIISASKLERLSVCYVCDIDDKRCMFTHYPLFNDNSYDKHHNKNITKILEEVYTTLDCDFNIHGHIHSKIAKESFCINVCVENTKLEPIMMSELLEDINPI